jgi:hypothetical protein
VPLIVLNLGFADNSWAISIRQLVCTHLQIARLLHCIDLLSLVLPMRNFGLAACHLIVRDALQGPEVATAFDIRDLPGRVS